MSFDLVAFRTEKAIPAKGAADLLASYDKRDWARLQGTPERGPLPRVKPVGPLGDFYDSLVARFPDLDALTEEQFEEEDATPWTVGILGPWDDHVDLCISWSRVSEVAPFVVQLGLDCGVAVYDPQLLLVYIPGSIAGTTRATVTSSHLLVPVRGYDELIADLVGTLPQREDPFIIVERGDEVYMQALWTEQGRVLEYREGSADRHSRAEHVAAVDVTSALVHYLHEREDWRSLASFEPVTL